MTKKNSILDKKKSPTIFSEEVGKKYSSIVSKEHKKNLGQFFTPAKVASFMAGLIDIKFKKKKIKILDPGSGVLTLTCALVERLISENKTIKNFEIDAFETDLSIKGLFTQVSDYLKKWCIEKGVELKINYIETDFLLFHKSTFKNNINSSKYDLILSNPPYFKLKKEDERLKIFKDQLKGQQNIYSLFLLASSKLLKNQGELVFLVPRSFTSGAYFQTFQRLFKNEVDFDYFHLFKSRTDGFKKDKVLQENIILKAIKRSESNSKIKISSSRGVNDLDFSDFKEFQRNTIFKKVGELQIIHLPVNTYEEKAMTLFSKWTYNLETFGMRVSTGPIVPFRCKGQLEHKKLNDSSFVPLIWMHNCLKMKLNWPKIKINKEIWILDNEQSKTIINQNYIFIRRFSSKEENSKLIATPYLKENFEHKRLGIENHLNYLYRINGILEIEEVFGLSVLYNSSIFDSYIRSMSGNTQVSATELNSIPLPSIEIIKKIGNQYMSLNGQGINEIDNIVNKIFSLK